MPEDSTNSQNPDETKPVVPQQQEKSEDKTAAEPQKDADRIAQLQDDLLRARAENQNIAKRLRADIGRAELRGTENVLDGMLEIVDSLEQALAKRTNDDLAALRDGVALTLAKFNQVLSTHGMETIEPQPGDKLDPHFHMAISFEAHGGFAANSVVRVLLKGYRHKQRILRPANVVVAKADTTDEKAKQEQEQTPSN